MNTILIPTKVERAEGNAHRVIHVGPGLARGWLARKSKAALRRRNRSLPLGEVTTRVLDACVRLPDGRWVWIPSPACRRYPVPELRGVEVPASRVLPCE
jgi:hypothetical protein